MKKYQYAEAKELIRTICSAAHSGEYDTREKFMSELKRNPYLATAGYNAFGKIFYWNDASVHLYGHREADAINQDLVELILPPEMRKFARDMILNARKTGRMPEPSACDLLRHDGEYITVFSGHMVFQWTDTTSFEFYSIDLPLTSEDGE